ncbi:unnamed protein product [Cylicocyclus nassatus]|uniref:Uncharacterized protein n=1 Tax=Cylicocyclus nassatus TaxID=53992 RepID=A0AA36MIJ4_CYLNA|nr:unnamed protein product [Cylicocyclus nassatus]
MIDQTGDAVRGHGSPARTPEIDIQQELIRQAGANRQRAIDVDGGLLYPVGGERRPRTVPVCIVPGVQTTLTGVVPEGSSDLTNGGGRRGIGRGRDLAVGIGGHIAVGIAATIRVVIPHGWVCAGQKICLIRHDRRVPGFKRDLDCRSLLGSRKGAREVVVHLVDVEQSAVIAPERRIRLFDEQGILQVFVSEPLIPDQAVRSERKNVKLERTLRGTPI